eukprot:scaffold41047_cov372-Skeletonema_marinoi.AAC.1
MHVWSNFALARRRPSHEDREARMSPQETLVIVTSKVCTKPDGMISQSDEDEVRIQTNAHYCTYPL